MFWIFLLVFVFVLVFVIMYGFTEEKGLASFVGTICCIFALLYVLSAIDADFSSLLYYETSSENTYSIKKITDGSYFESSSGSDGIAVYILQKDGTYKKETYCEELVTFTQGNTASVTIIEEKGVAIDAPVSGKLTVEQAKRWLWIDISNEVRIKEIIISLPENHTILPVSPGEENSETTIPEQTASFCTDCGKEMKDDYKYCSNCGKKKD